MLARAKKETTLSRFDYYLNVHIPSSYFVTAGTVLFHVLELSSFTFALMQLTQVLYVILFGARLAIKHNTQTYKFRIALLHLNNTLYFPPF